MIAVVFHAFPYRNKILYLLYNIICTGKIGSQNPWARGYWGEEETDSDRSVLQQRELVEIINREKAPRVL